MSKLPHPKAGQTVQIKAKGLEGRETYKGDFHLEDWWENVAGKSWMTCNGNPACLNYAMRSGFSGLPIDDDVVYGKVGGLGYLVHESEISA